MISSRLFFNDPTLSPNERLETPASSAVDIMTAAPLTLNCGLRKRQTQTATSKPSQAVTERTARFDAANVFIQRAPVFCQPLTALRLTDNFGQLLLSRQIEDHITHCVSLTAER